MIDDDDRTVFSDLVTKRSEDWGVIVSAETEEAAQRALEKEEQRIIDNIEKGDEKDELYRAEVDRYPHNKGKYLYVYVAINAGERLGNYSPITYLQADNERWISQYSVENGFVHWQDYVADNYCIRSLIRAFTDENLRTGNTEDFRYKFRLFKTITEFWD